MSSGQNSSHLSDAEEQKRRKNRAVTKHRAAKKEEEEKRKTAIRQYKEDNMRLEASIQVMRAEGELLRSFVEAHEEASGGDAHPARAVAPPEQTIHPRQTLLEMPREKMRLREGIEDGNNQPHDGKSRDSGQHHQDAVSQLRNTDSTDRYRPG